MTSCEVLMGQSDSIRLEEESCWLGRDALAGKDIIAGSTRWNRMLREEYQPGIYLIRSGDAFTLKEKHDCNVAIDQALRSAGWIIRVYLRQATNNEKTHHEQALRQQSCGFTTPFRRKMRASERCE